MEPADAVFSRDRVPLGRLDGLALHVPAPRRNENFLAPVNDVSDFRGLGLGNQKEDKRRTENCRRRIDGVRSGPWITFACWKVRAMSIIGLSCWRRVSEIRRVMGSGFDQPAGDESKHSRALGGLCPVVVGNRRQSEGPAAPGTFSHAVDRVGSKDCALVC